MIIKLALIAVLNICLSRICHCRTISFFHSFSLSLLLPVSLSFTLQLSFFLFMLSKSFDLAHFLSQHNKSNAIPKSVQSQFLSITASTALYLCLFICITDRFFIIGISLKLNRAVDFSVSLLCHLVVWINFNLQSLIRITKKKVLKRLLICG